MGWGNCGTDSQGRPIGYIFEAICDHPGCKEKIDRDWVMFAVACTAKTNIVARNIFVEIIKL